ncbi:hypothetical protein [Embleya scabrispora]|uniref:hypothetical protein n=1 Tax=Embleya scabrispora TaxID=159449 RepID=UPI00039E9712|nr:hypothetical protein [Embleya scabrispora]
MSAATKSGTVAAFMRFVFFGGGTGLASGAVLVALSGHLSIVVANAVVTVVFTLLATELHSRFTFRAGRARGRVHVQSALSAGVSYLFTTGAMLALHAMQPAPGVLKEQAVYLTASGAAGIARFLFLRFVVTPKALVATVVPASATTGVDMRTVEPTVVVGTAAAAGAPTSTPSAAPAPKVMPIPTPAPVPVRVAVSTWASVATVVLPAMGERTVPTRASLVATA